MRTTNVPNSGRVPSVLPRHSRRRLAPRCLVPLLLTALVAGCGSPAATLGAVAKIALSASGLTAPELPDSQKPPLKVPMAIATGKNLNADARGRPLAAVVKIYKLKDTTAFYQAPFNAFVTPGSDKAALGDDLVDTREITLIPDQQLNWTESVPRTANAIGVVVLFHSPGAQRWRFAFDAAVAEKSGIVMGAHACALTITRGAVLPLQGSGSASPAPAYNQLVQVNCPT